MKHSIFSKVTRNSLTALAFTLAGALPVSALAADYTLKLSMPTINDMQFEWSQMFKEELEAASENRIEVQIYPANQLGPIASVIEGLQLGSIEATITPAEFYVGVDKRYQAPAVPGLFTSMEDAREKLDAPEARDALLAVGVDKGLRGIAAVVYGPQVVISRMKTDNIAGLAAQKIRVLSSETEIGTINSLGASAVPMPLNEVPAALQQGALDGASTVLDVFISLKSYDVAPTAVPTELWYTISLATVSDIWFQSLPEDLQQAVLASAQSAEERMFARQLERQATNNALWTENGGVIVELSDEEQAKAQESAAVVAETFLSANPDIRELYDLIKGSN
ncbi:TRAP transporter substrate-binding protein [Aureimonas fodinaquatilis]|uniref:TRAP transporter substrate-binding protein n=1 Tax=Aureimonas fodinaquatilis TaxID=2565783 RepID=A0A5B0DU12_9HYPH|nr:TRAP transporter substrate-binding protein [Aureimonas fodinaquatilis]KAA0969492.1 TRAP transporter substrate-binding protein [Aureimonas fodinaquatilis]